MGAEIEGEGHLDDPIQGVDRPRRRDPPGFVTDRIELGTYMLAPASPRPKLNAGRSHGLWRALTEKLDAAVCSVDAD